MTIIPVTFRRACAFIREHHRHHLPPRGMRFCLGLADEERLAGVATVGRPIARHFDDGFTLEVTRTCTDGTKNANNMLYEAAWRAARALGYRRLITYTQAGETGNSLRAAGWRVIAERAPRKNWAQSSKKLRHLRDESAPNNVQRTLWEA